MLVRYVHQSKHVLQNGHEKYYINSYMSLLYSLATDMIAQIKKDRSHASVY
jgi:hypothetical protein